MGTYSNKVQFNQLEYLLQHISTIQQYIDHTANKQDLSHTEYRTLYELADSIFDLYMKSEHVKDSLIDRQVKASKLKQSINN